MTTITLEYRVKDSWGNKSSILSRTVYIYESRQYGNHAFYATPITDASGAPFDSYYDNNASDPNNPFLTSVRKDSDGDGVSDYWEYALGFDYKNKLSKPNLSDPAVFQSLSSLSISELSARLSKMNDFSSLSSVSGISDFNSTLGL